MTPADARFALQNHAAQCAKERCQWLQALQWATASVFSPQCLTCLWVGSKPLSGHQYMQTPQLAVQAEQQSLLPLNQ